MRTIGFYSFKGGVGRSNLVLNIASHLAKAGYHTGILDLDLEAPGLTVTPPLQPPEDAPYPDKGLIDFFSRSTLALQEREKKTSDDSCTSDESEKKKIPEITDIFYETRLGLKGPGSVHLAPAISLASQQRGQQGYPKGTGSIYQRFSEEMAICGKKINGRPIGSMVFAFIRKKIAEHAFPVTLRGERVEKELDFLLVDLRTGLNELADSAVGSLVLELFIVCGLNRQNRDGMKTALISMSDTLRKADFEQVRVMPVFSPLPNAELDRVRAKLDTVYRDLISLAREHHWLELESPLQLLVPQPTNRDGATTWRKELLTIHYCDYLAVGDEVLIEKYPETLAAEEILRIARRFTRNPEDLAAETIRGFQESGVLRSMKAKKEEQKIWQWIPAYLKDIPSWNWPVELFANNREKADAITKESLTALGKLEQDETLLNGIAASISLEPEEKTKILQALSSVLTPELAGNLSLILQQERDKFAAFPQEQLPQLGELICQHTVRWPTVLQNYSFSLTPSADQVERIFSLNAIGRIPIWAVLYGYTLADEDQTVKTMAVKKLLSHATTPPSLLVKVLDKLPSDQAGQLKHLVATWWNGLQEPNFTAGQLNNLGIDFIDKFHLFQEAEKAYKKAVELDEKYASPWNGLGNLYKNHLDRYQEAEEAYKKAIELDEKYASPWNGLGNLYQDHLDRYQEAEEAYKKAIELDEKFADPWNGLGYLYQNHLDRYQEAEEAYKKAIELDEKFAPPWNGLGNLYQDHLDRYQEAEEAYKQYLELTQDGDRAYGLYNYLRLLSQTQKNEQKYQTQLARATEWAKETLSKPGATTVELIQAALLGLCSLDDLLSATLDLLRKKSMNKEDRLWLAILSGIGCEPTAWVMPDFAGADFAASELESSLRLTAMLRHRLPAPILKQLTSRLVTALKTFTPPHGSRPVSASAILPALRALGLKPFPGE